MTFTESGLPAGTAWSVTMSGSTNSSTTASIGFTEPNGTYSFTVGSVAGYTASPSSGTVTVNGAAAGVTITFTQVTYSVTFTESGLPSGTSWSVTMNGSTLSSTSTTITFTEPNGTYAFTVGAVAGYSSVPSSGSITVSGATQTQSIAFSPTKAPMYAVTFTESGLPSGTSWSVTLNGVTMSSTTATITFTEPNGTYAFTVGSVAGYTASPPSGSILVNGGPVSQAITFAPSSRATYSVTFTERGLPSGTSWSVTFNGTTQPSTTTSIVFSNYLNGTYTYIVGAVAGYNVAPASGSVTISGASKTVSITFTPSTAATYAVTFSESGLPSGTSWSVILNGTSKSGTGSLAFTEQNGTYSFSVGAIAGYSVSPSSGSIPVNGAAVSKSITFTALPPGQYSLNISETGLPASTNWSVTVGTTTHSSTGTTISFAEVNGTYHYTVGAVTGYTVSTSSGNVTVNGAAKTVAVTFSKSSLPPGEKYSVTFTESGLPSGTSWSVTLNGSTLSSTTSTITFQEPNGTYAFTVGSVSGYTWSPSSGTVKVNSGPASQSVTFSKTNQTTGFLGLPGYEGYIVVGVIVAAVAAGVAIMLMRKRTPPRGSGAVQDSKNIADGAAQQVAVE